VTGASDLLSRHELSRRRAVLLSRICRRFSITTEILNFGPARVQFTRVVDPDVVLDQAVIEEDRRQKLTGSPPAPGQLHLPYWAQLWDSAFALGEYLVANPACLMNADRTKSASVLDLGCGMGLVGTVAAAMRARVVLADIVPDALLFARLNSIPYSRRAQTRRLDWQSDQLNDRFDRILGADVLYEKEQWPFLDRFWRSHLRTGGTVLLGEPGRQSGDSFIQWISDRNWRLREFSQVLRSRGKTIRLIELARA
jgi:predicted nicotinamide N-methyase